MYTGTIKNAVNQQMLQMKWEKKKQEINAGKDKKDMTPEESMMSHFQDQMVKERESQSHAETYSKLQSGGTLTNEEIKYLEEHDPEALMKYRAAQAEKKAYENALKNCKTKEDAERLKMTRLGSFAAEAKSIMNNPYIPKDKKLELMGELNNKVCLTAEAHKKFVSSQEYRDMPRDAELQKERTEEALENLDKMQEAVMDSAESAENMEQAVQNPEVAESTVSDTKEDSTGSLSRDLKTSHKTDSGDMDIEEDAKERLKKADREKKQDIHEALSQKEDPDFESLLNKIGAFLREIGSEREKTINITV